MISEPVSERVADLLARVKLFHPQPAEKPVIERKDSPWRDSHRIRKFGLHFGQAQRDASDYACWLRRHPKFRCAYCDESPSRRKRQVDHVIPLSSGGQHTLANVVPCCSRCNHEKKDRELAGQPKVAPWLTVRVWRSQRP